MSFTHLDLFSGIGGFALAVRWLGGKTVAFCDTDPFSQSVLRKNFPGVPIHDDIHTLRGDAYGPVDLVTGGFPCQPYSIAGQRRGAADDRALWPEMRRVIDEAQPRYVLGENVTGIISMELDTVLSDLEADGYAAWAVVVPAVAVDAPHRRDRVWIMAHRDDGQRDLEDEAICAGRDASLGRGEPLADSRRGDGKRRPHTPAGNHADREDAGWQEAASGPNQRSEDVADTDRQRQPQPEGIEQDERGWTGDGCRWSPEPGVGRMADGVPGRVDRLRGLGNAIVPQVAYEILRVMLEDAA